MCRASADGGRRCTGGTSHTRTNTTHRKQLSRARKRLAAAQTADDPDRTADAQARLDHLTRDVTPTNPPPNTEPTQPNQPPSGDTGRASGDPTQPDQPPPDDTGPTSDHPTSTTPSADRAGDVTVVTNPRGPINFGPGPQINLSTADRDDRAAARQRRAAQRQQRTAQRRADHQQRDQPEHGDVTPPTSRGIGRITATNLTHIQQPTGPVNLGTGAQTFHHTTGADHVHVEIRDGQVWINGERQA